MPVATINRFPVSYRDTRSRTDGSQELTEADLDKLQPGHLIFSRAGTVRVVRKVTRWEARSGPFRGRVVTYYADCTIRHCSWTHRCYTCLHRSELKRNYELVDVIVPLDSELDRRIDEEIRNHGPRTMSCCDVKGID